MLISKVILYRSLKAVALVSLVVGSIAYGIAIDHYRLFPYYQIRSVLNEVRVNRANRAPEATAEESGRWGILRQPGTNNGAGAGTDGNPGSLADIGYAGAYNAPTGASGAETLAPDKLMPGLTLYSSGHRPAVYLIDEEGVVVHTWTTSFEKMWPDGLQTLTLDEHKRFIRRARLLPEGDLLIVFEYIGIGRLDKDSNVLWRSQGGNHHDIEITGSGTIASLGSLDLSVDELTLEYPDLEATGDVRDDLIVVLDPNGNELSRWSLLRAFYQSEFAQFLSRAASEGDIFHANSLDFIDEELAESSALFEEGDILVSIRNMDAVAILSTSTGLVKWVATGKWRQQHQAQALPNGNIVLFDNQGGNSEYPLRADRSRALEFDPETLSTVWQYPAATDQILFTHRLGYVQRLQNGNTLITESAQGHIVEVDSDSEVVWEYYSPYRGGSKGELIATIMGAQRIGANQLGFLAD